ncbi:hypothetical protein SS50377_23823 [Spironucleus salmonicida]|nr:hypothetical protein SS50377_23823 [Spironucleus salmonicida]
MSRQNVLPEQRTPRILKRNSSSFNFCVTPQKILDKLELDILRGTSELEILKKRLQKVDKYCIQIEDQLHQKL